MVVVLSSLYGSVQEYCSKKKLFPMLSKTGQQVRKKYYLVAHETVKRHKKRFSERHGTKSLFFRMYTPGRCRNGYSSSLAGYCYWMGTTISITGTATYNTCTLMMEHLLCFGAPVPPPRPWACLLLGPPFPVH